MIKPRRVISKFRKGDVGRSCLVRWDDLGLTQEMIIEVDDDRKEATSFCFATSNTNRITIDQIAKIGNFVYPPKMLVYPE